MDDITLFTIGGRKAQVLRLIFGTPFLFIGGVLVLVGLLSGTTQETVIAASVGVIVGFVGLYSYVTAFRGKEIAITLSEGSGSDGGGFDGGGDGGGGE